MMIGTSLVRRMARQTSKPSMSGSMMSISTTSAGWRIGALHDGGAGLAGDQAAGGQVPRLEALLVEGVDPPAAHPAQVDGRRATAPDVADGGQDGGEQLRLAGPLVGRVAEAGR